MPSRREQTTASEFISLYTNARALLDHGNTGGKTLTAIRAPPVHSHPISPEDAAMPDKQTLLHPLHFKNLSVKNRIFRSNISGRFDNYDGSGNQARINWETKFARGGVGAVITSFVPVLIEGRIVPNYATIHQDDRIPFWRKVGESVHEYDCRIIMQLSHSGRQRDIGGVENPNPGLSSTSSTESFHGLLCHAMTKDDIQRTIHAFGQGARRAREAGLDGVELHGANGYLITQFLSSGINDRTDEYGGSLENRARFVLEIVREIRRQVGTDFHLQMKISAEDFNNAVIPYERPGNHIEDTVQICQWLEKEDVDAIHVSVGSIFPHPMNPPGTFPLQGHYPSDRAETSYDTMLSSGNQTLRNYLLFHIPILRPIFTWLWNRVPNHQFSNPNVIQGNKITSAQLAQDFQQFVPLQTMQSLLDKFQGRNLAYAKKIKEAVSLPIICTGGFQQASLINTAIENGYCDAVSMARMLVANNDLVQKFKEGLDVPERPCTYCNKCLLNTLENPLGCYEPSRFNGNYNEMIDQVMTVFHPQPFPQ